jgi:hypothetical protein
MSLWTHFLANDGRSIHKWRHYFPIYERHFGLYVNRPLTMLEIVCADGGSLQMWKRYFGPHALIVGVDINPQCSDFQEDQIEIRVGDQSEEDFLSDLVSEFGQFDIVLDDGSHRMSHVVASFRYLYPRMGRDGIYAVEDMHTAYWDEYGGGLRRPGTFIEVCKDLIDELNADWSRNAIPPTDFTKSTLSIHFYDSMVIFERGRNLTKEALRTPSETSFRNTVTLHGHQE